MKKALILLCALFFALGLISIYAMNAEKPQPQAGTQAEAQRLWELAIAAKGGRQRLYAVRNMLISTTGGSKYHTVDLHVFPDKFWSWAGEPEPLGQSANMYNLEQRVAYSSNSGRPGAAAVKLHESNLGGGRIELVDAQLFYLMETQWVKPTLVGVSSGEVGWHRADVVRTQFEGRTIDYYLDRKTHLPLKVALVDESNGREYMYETQSDYANIDGIQLPLKVDTRGTGNLSNSYQFNVEYDQQLFERPPSALAGPDAWRRK
ncbi:MAG TPA: hypothetical protein VGC89_21590 [Pyrinomonadaceae bacterium]|jgi:hypothetical protein